VTLNYNSHDTLKHITKVNLFQIVEPASGNGKNNGAKFSRTCKLFNKFSTSEKNRQTNSVNIDLSAESIVFCQSHDQTRRCVGVFTCHFILALCERNIMYCDGSQKRKYITNGIHRTRPSRVACYRRASRAKGLKGRTDI